MSKQIRFWKIESRFAKLVETHKGNDYFRIIVDFSRERNAKRANSHILKCRT